MALSKAAITAIIKCISIGLYIAALTQPCFDTQDQLAESGQGALLLISGFFGFFSSLTGLTWLANPLLLLSWIFQGKKPRLSLIFNIAAVCFALLFLGCSEIIANEGGSTTTLIKSKLPGYWLWLASTLVMLCSNLYLKATTNTEGRSIG